MDGQGQRLWGAYESYSKSLGDLIHVAEISKSKISSVYSSHTGQNVTRASGQGYKDSFNINVQGSEWDHDGECPSVKFFILFNLQA